MTTAFRPFPPMHRFFDHQRALVAGGYVNFYDTGTDTPRVVYGDKALSVNNGSTLDLDSAGQFVVGDCWGSGSYRVRLYSADDVLIDEDEDVEIPGGTATALPTLAADEFITSDGSVLVATTIRELPDPTGQANKVLSTDGTVYTWVAKPVDGADPDFTIGTDGGFQFGATGDPTKFLIQAGIGIAPAAASVHTSVGITFDTPYASITAVLIAPTIASVSTSGGGGIPVHAVTGYTPGSPATSVTVNWRNPADGDIIDSGDHITTPVSFVWVAFGTVEVP